MKPDVCCSKEKHKKHLEEARVLAVAALRAAWSHWTGSLRESRRRWLDNSDGTTLHPLDDVPSPETVASILAMVGHEDTISNAVEACKHMSGIAFTHYLHESPSANDILRVPANCRDVRYKFDFDRLLAAASEPEFREQIEEIAAATNACEANRDSIELLLSGLAGVEDRLTFLEAGDIAERLVSLTPKQSGEILAPLEPSAVASREDVLKLASEALLSLWRVS